MQLISQLGQAQQSLDVALQARLVAAGRRGAVARLRAESAAGCARRPQSAKHDAERAADTLGDVVLVDRNDAADVAASEVDRDVLRQDLRALLETLPAKERFVITALYGLDGTAPMSHQAIADSVNVPRATIVKLEESAMSTLQSPSRLALMLPFQGLLAGAADEAEALPAPAKAPATGSGGAQPRAARQRRAATSAADSVLQATAKAGARAGDGVTEEHVLRGASTGAQPASQRRSRSARPERQSSSDSAAALVLGH